MKNYKDSDYALNKYSEGIVYPNADGGRTVVTLRDYLAENPGKTEADFQTLKELSDAIYFEQDRNDFNQTRKNVPLHGIEGTEACSVPSPEDEVIEQPEQAAIKKRRLELMYMALDKLTAVQRRRYLLYVAEGLNEREIAEKEGATQQAVSKSIYWAEKKIKKFLAATKK